MLSKTAQARCSHCQVRAVRYAGQICTDCKVVTSPIAAPVVAPAHAKVVCVSCKNEFTGDADAVASLVCPTCTGQLVASSGMGDFVAAVTKKFGFEPSSVCGCDARRKALNAVNRSQPPHKLIGAIARAIFRPNG